MRILNPVWLMLILAASPALATASDVGSHSVSCKEGKSRYLLFRPAANAETMPAVLLLHGAGGEPGPMIEIWKDLARKEHFALIAPELPREEKFEEIAPAIFRCDVEDAKQFGALDARRIYVFGHSMGGYLAYDAATLSSEYFAGVAVHGMRIADDYEWIVEKAKRKTPIAIYIGDHDQFVPLEGARKTRDLLKKAGFPVHYVEIKNHDHNYSAVAGQVNADAWNFLRQAQLPPRP